MLNQATHIFQLPSYSNAERLTMIQDVSKSPMVLEIDPLPDVNLDGIKVLKANEVEDGDFTVDESNFVEGDEITILSLLQVLLVSQRVYKSVMIIC